MRKKYRVFSTIIGIILVCTLMLLLWVSPKSPDFSQYDAGIDRKTAFFSYFIPIIQQQNNEILLERAKLVKWQKAPKKIGWWDRQSLVKKAVHYRVKNFDLNNQQHWQQLLNKVDALPVSLALAQAANESAWGTSRFAVKGRNYFGQWCFEQGCGIVPQQRDNAKAHEVAVFNSPKDSVASYLRNLNSHPAYAKLRVIRLDLVNRNQKVTGIALAEGLLHYSERGEHYIAELRDMISFNKLEQYD